MSIKLLLFVLWFTILGATPSVSSENYALRIFYKEDKASIDKVYFLNCKPAFGTLSKPKVKCSQLLKVTSPFSASDSNQICSQIFGGPETARIYGYWEGKKIKAKFSKSDGCQIDRWNKINFLFPK